MTHNELDWINNRVVSVSDMRLLKQTHLQREAKTAELMIGLYCQHHHNQQTDSLCPGCCELLEFSNRRLAYCPFGEDKPTCAKCQVHCYKSQMRQPMRQVMRWAGPRMIWHHPWLTLRHLLDKFRKAPSKVPKKKDLKNLDH